LRIIPHLGQISEYSSKPASSEHWGVFHDDVERSHLANDSGLLAPKPAAGAVDAFAGAVGRADVLAREASRNHVNTAPPRSSVKGANVVPDRERREKSVILPGTQYSSGVGVPLDGAHGAPPEDFAPEYASTSACE
jgi:hypothetical protein